MIKLRNFHFRFGQRSSGKKIIHEYFHISAYELRAKVKRWQYSEFLWRESETFLSQRHFLEIQGLEVRALSSSLSLHLPSYLRQKRELYHPTRYHLRISALLSVLHPHCTGMATWGSHIHEDWPLGTDTEMLSE